MNLQVLTDGIGREITISRLIEGCAHDMRAPDESGLEDLPAPADAVIADKGLRARATSPRARSRSAGTPTRTVGARP